MLASKVVFTPWRRELSLGLPHAGCQRLIGVVEYPFLQSLKTWAQEFYMNLLKRVKSKCTVLPARSSVEVTHDGCTDLPSVRK